MSAFPTISPDPVTGAIGRRPSGAKLYHRGSVFGRPVCRRLDRNVRTRIMWLAAALDRRTGAKGKQGGVFKRTGLVILRVLLWTFHNPRTGECFPSYEAIAAAAGCSRDTVARMLRILENLGIVETIRRKAVCIYRDRARQVRIDVVVQTSNSYRFNYAYADRRHWGDLTLPLLQPHAPDLPQFEADSRNQTVTSKEILSSLPSDLAAALAGLGRAMDERDRRQKEASEKGCG